MHPQLPKSADQINHRFHPPDSQLIHENDHNSPSGAHASYPLGQRTISNADDSTCRNAPQHTVKASLPQSTLNRQFPADPLDLHTKGRSLHEAATQFQCRLSQSRLEALRWQTILSHFHRFGPVDFRLPPTQYKQKDYVNSLHTICTAHEGKQKAPSLRR